MTVQVKHVTASRTGQWWVINTSPPSGSPTIYTVMEGTQGEADTFPNGGGVSGPYGTLAQANTVAAHEPENKTQPTPIPGVGITPGGGFTASNPLSGLAAIGDFFSKLTQASTWIRVGEVLLGLALITVGLAQLASGTAAGRAALKAGKAAAIL